MSVSVRMAIHFHTFEGERVTEGAGGEKFETNDGTKKFGLPCIWLDALAIETKTSRKPVPETVRVLLGTARWMRMSQECPQPCFNLSISVTTQRVKDSGVGTWRRRQLAGMTWQRSGVQTGCKTIVGAM